MTMNEMEKKRAEEAPFSAAETKKMVIDHLSEISGISETGITPNCDISRDLSLDSLDKVELVMWCEKNFNITISADEEENIKTVEQLLSTIERKLA